MTVCAFVIALPFNNAMLRFDLSYIQARNGKPCFLLYILFYLCVCCTVFFLLVNIEVYVDISIDFSLRKRTTVSQ